MKVRLLVGFTNGLNPGDEYEGEDAVKLIRAGFAVPIAETVIETTAAAPARERRTRKKKA